MSQEHEPFVKVSPQMPRQRVVGRHHPRRPRQFPQPLVELRPCLFQHLRRHFALAVAVAQVDRFGEQGNQLPRVINRSPARPGFQFAHAPQHVGEALLVGGLHEAVVRREAVMGHRASPIAADQPLQDVGAALPVDGVAGGTPRHPGMQPGRIACHPPTRFVRRQARRRLDLCADLLVGWLQPPRGTQHDLGAGAARQGDAEEGREDCGHLAVRQAESLVQRGRGGLGVGAKLTGGCSQGTGGLQRMAALEAPATTAAAADVDGELADERPAGDFGLVLRGNLSLLNLAAAVRTSAGKWGIEDLIALAGLRWLAVAVATVRRAALATGRLGLELGRPLGEGSGLTLGLAVGLVDLGPRFGKLALQTLVVSTQPFVLLPKLSEFRADLLQLLKNGEGHGHRVAHLDRRHRCLGTIDPPRPLLCESKPKRQGALIKYPPGQSLSYNVTKRLTVHHYDQETEGHLNEMLMFDRELTQKVVTATGRVENERYQGSFNRKLRYEEIDGFNTVSCNYEVLVEGEVKANIVVIFTVSLISG